MTALQGPSASRNARRWLLQTILHLDQPLRGDNPTDTAAVLRALRAGATTIAVPPLGNPLTAHATITTAPRPGSHGPIAGAHLNVTAPPATTVRVLRDGRTILHTDPTDAPFPLTTPGLHRIEVHRPGPHGAPSPWILPSPTLLT